LTQTTPSRRWGGALAACLVLAALLAVGGAASADAQERAAPQPLWKAYPLNTGRLERQHTPPAQLEPMRPAVRPATLSHADGTPSPLWWLLVIAGSAAAVFLAAQRRPSTEPTTKAVGPASRRSAPRRPLRPGEHALMPAPPQHPGLPKPRPRDEREARFMHVTGNGSGRGAQRRYVRRHRTADDIPDDKEV
jgi:hypothetical protein